MPYFPVDDDMSFHPKVLTAGNDAIGVWTRAGALCKKHVTGGFVSTEMARTLGPLRLAERLVSAGLWDAAEGGFQFHDWEHQAGNFDAAKEAAMREAERERWRLSKQKQRGNVPTVPAGTSTGHASESTPLSRVPPSPSPSPLSTDTQERPALETAASYPQGTDEGESIEGLCARQASALGVDYSKVKSAIGKACGRFPDPTGVMRIIATVLERAKPPIKSPTGVVLTAVRNDWAEWQQFLDEEAA